MACYVVQSNQTESTEGIPALRQYCIATSVGFLFGVHAMKHIPLTQGLFAIVDDSDYDWLNTMKWCAVTDPCTSYAIRTVKRNGIQTRMHRLILNCPKNLVVDHINHNGLDNRRANIRICTRRENSSNLKNHGRSQYIGVTWHPQTSKWRATIKEGNRLISLGLHFTEIDASHAYQQALREINHRTHEIHGQDRD